MFKIQKH